jgi:glycosyltransferase involved in cell wall biosynthesis
MPVHNGEAFIAEALGSILDQSFGDFELIVVDDNSTDATPSIVDQHRAKDPRITMIEADGRGFVAAVNTGIQASRGEWIARMDADDRSHPDRFREQVGRVEAEPDLSLLGTSARVIGVDGGSVATIRYPMQDAQIRLVLRRHTTFAHGSVLMRRTAVLSVGGYRDSHFPVEDYDLWCRLAVAGFRTANLDAPLYDYRLSPEGTSRTKAEQQASMAREVGDAFGAAVRRGPTLGAVLESVGRSDDAVRSGLADPRALRRVARSVIDAAPRWARTSPATAMTCVVASARAEVAYRRRRKSGSS